MFCFVIAILIREQRSGSCLVQSCLPALATTPRLKNEKSIERKTESSEMRSRASTADFDSTTVIKHPSKPHITPVCVCRSMLHGLLRSGHTTAPIPTIIQQIALVGQLHHHRTIGYAPFIGDGSLCFAPGFLCPIAFCLLLYEGLGCWSLVSNTKTKLYI